MDSAEAVKLIISELSSASPKSVLTRDLAHRLQLEKREVNRLLYRLEIDGIAQRVTVKPPAWRLTGEKERGRIQNKSLGQQYEISATDSFSVVEKQLLCALAENAHWMKASELAKELGLESTSAASDGLNKLLGKQMVVMQQSENGIKLWQCSQSPTRRQFVQGNGRENGGVDEFAVTGRSALPGRQAEQPEDDDWDPFAVPSASFGSGTRRHVEMMEGMENLKISVSFQDDGDHSAPAKERVSESASSMQQQQQQQLKREQEQRLEYEQRQRIEQEQRQRIEQEQRQRIEQEHRQQLEHQRWLDQQQQLLQQQSQPKPRPSVEYNIMPIPGRGHSFQRPPTRFRAAEQQPVVALQSPSSPARSFSTAVERLRAVSKGAGHGAPHYTTKRTENGWFSSVRCGRHTFSVTGCTSKEEAMERASADACKSLKRFLKPGQQADIPEFRQPSVPQQQQQQQQPRPRQFPPPQQFQLHQQSQQPQQFQYVQQVEQSQQSRRLEQRQPPQQFQHLQQPQPQQSQQFHHVQQPQPQHFQQLQPPQEPQQPPKEEWTDYKSALNAFYSHQSLPFPTFNTEKVGGRYLCTLQLNDGKTITNQVPTPNRKEAERDAAKRALEYLKKEGQDDAIEFSYKNELQTVCTQGGKPTPVYESTQTKDGLFEAAVIFEIPGHKSYLAKKVSSNGRYRTSGIAEQNAAKEALALVRKLHGGSLRGRGAAVTVAAQRGGRGSGRI